MLLLLDKRAREKYFSFNYVVRYLLRSPLHIKTL